MVQRYELNIKSIEAAIQPQIAAAQQIVEAAQLAVTDAEARGDQSRADVLNLKLSLAKRTLRTLETIQRSAQDCCCDEPAYNCVYEI